MIAALFVRKDTVYKSLGADCWDEVRDARLYPGPFSVVAHPPCAQWARLRHFAHSNSEAKKLAIFAVDFVRRWGGVLEHPAHSLLWDFCHLPKPGSPARGKEFSIAVPQVWWGHRAEKKDLVIFLRNRPKPIANNTIGSSPSDSLHRYIKERKKHAKAHSQKPERSDASGICGMADGSRFSDTVYLCAAKTSLP